MSNEKLVLSHTAALNIDLKQEPIEAEQKVADKTPHSTVTTGFIELGELNGNQVGIWAMSVGEMTDVETDEYFVVLSGRGTVRVLAENGFAEQSQNLFTGSVVRLHAGMHTVWTVEETLRKVYFTPSED
ncbi:MAG: cupin domain-containing protein [Yaniella sp.]|uniref:cupin domain-containing protein n=1 Tax=Yaniella sp. TaxID=2773929 RepID=UPI003F9C723B